QGLLQDQTIEWVQSIGATAQHVASKLNVIGFRIIAAEAQAKSVLAARCAVTSARIAATDVERGNDLTVKADRLRLCEVLDLNRKARRLAAGFYNQGCLTILQRSEKSIGSGGDYSCLLRPERTKWCQVALAAVRVLSGND